MAAEKNIGKINLDNFAEKRPLQENFGNSTGVEKMPGSSVEKPEIKKIEKIDHQINEDSSVGTGNIQVQSFQQKRALEIDNILSEGLHEVFLKMVPLRQQQFKLAGEETVSKIAQLLDKSKVNVGKIIDLIKKWLQLIPGVNKFFLEQEAKIKADKIMRIKDSN